MFRRLAAGGRRLARRLARPQPADPTVKPHGPCAGRQRRKSAAIFDFQPNAAVVQAMVDCGLTNFTGKTTVAAAWRSLVSTQDIVGIKVFSEPGMLTGTRPAVVAAVVHGLLAAGVPPTNIIIWDKHAYDLRAAGFFKLAAQLGVRAAGARKPAMTRRIFTGPTPPSSATSSGAIWNSARPTTGVGRKSFRLQAGQPADHQNHHHRAAAQPGGRRRLRPSLQPCARQRGQHAAF